MSGSQDRLLDLSTLTFLDVEADRAARPLEIALVRGDDARRVRIAGRTAQAIGADLAPLAAGRVAGHNLARFDLPLLRAAGLGPEVCGALDTLVAAMVADPTRPSYALPKSGDAALGAVPDPVADARAARELLAELVPAWERLEPELGELLAWLLDAGGHGGLRWLWEELHGPLAARSLDAALVALPEALLARLCRVRLTHLAATLASPAEHVGLALALSFVAARSRDGRLAGAPGAALVAWPRFHELVTRLMGPLCPDHHCPHRLACDVHRPFAEDVLREVFELPGFRPNQREIVEAVLGDRRPLAILPTGGGKSLCYQVPAVHGAQRLRGLTVVVSPLQALMADQVRSLAGKFPGTALVNSSLLQEERRRVLAGVRAGEYDVLYLGPEQLRNPSIVRLLSRRLPFLWVVDEAHCISQWGHGFRTDYTYLTRAIANIHGPERRPLVALFTATAGHEVIADIRRQVQAGLGVDVELMDFGGARPNLAYEVIPVGDDGAKARELSNLLAAHPEGSRLVYCATVRGVKDVGDQLRAQGIPCAVYHGQLPPNAKRAELERFLGGEVATVVATSAFGMGIDKPDIRLVVHHDLPGSVEDYVQETGRAGRDGAPSRCVLLFDERDLETQFFLKTAGLVTERDVRVVFGALRRRALRLPRDETGWVSLWVSPEELFVAEDLEAELDWAREGLQGRLKLVLYHLEADGVVERLENRTRTFAVHPLLPSLAAALDALPAPRSPATERVVRYLYDPGRPRELSILDLADECGLSPAESFRELHKLTEAKLIGQDLRFGVTAARGVARSTEERARHHLAVLATLCELDDAGEEHAVLGLRAAAAELSRRLRVPCPPHELLAALRALKRLGLVRLEKLAPGRFRVGTEGGFAALRHRLAAHRRAADALLSWLDEQLVGKSGRDLRVELDVQSFLDGQRTLFNRLAGDAAAGGEDPVFATVERDAVVETCLLLHHLEAWHLTDPPVLFDVSLKVRVDPRRTVRELDRTRPRRQREHEIALVHLLREYAVLPPERRGNYLMDYFARPRAELLERWFGGRKRALTRPVTTATEAAILDGLTPAQAAAVTAEEPALLVVAGPGSGKTHTIARRVAHLMRARQVRAEEILVLAFSRAAASELRERLVATIGERARHVRVRTFHGLALELTGDALDDDRRDSEAWLEGALERAAELLRDPGEPGAADGDAVERAGPGVGAGERDAAGEEHRARVLGGVRHVLVDEYQDLDPAQYAMLTGLVGAQRRAARGKGVLELERSVLVVGDDDQAIFAFRRASVEFIRRFEQDFGARRICLTESFRSHPAIVAAAGSLVRTLPNRVKLAEGEQIRAVRPDDAGTAARAVRRFVYDDPLGLAAHLGRVVERSLDAGTGSLAILAREWGELGTVRGQLEAAGIDFVLAHRDFHRPLHRRYLGDRVLRHLWREPRVIEGSAAAMLEALLAEWGRLDDPTARELQELVHEVDVERGPTPATRGSWAEIGSRELADRLLLASRDGARRDGAAGARVHLGTFHGAKGREFDKVVLLPVRPRPDADPDEERRLYYVAMTRARDELVLATYGDEGELAREVPAPTEDLARFRGRYPAREIAYLDCEPADVVIHSVELARAQGLISALREGAPLEVRETGERVELWPVPLASPSPQRAAPASTAAPAPSEPAPTPAPARQRAPYRGFVAVLATRGRERYQRLRARFRQPPTARVHEAYVHLVRDKAGAVKDRVLVVVPTLRFERA